MKTAIIVGAGHRALLYASYATHHPDKMRIVGVADPDPLRRQLTAGTFNLAPEQCYESAEVLASRGKLADCVINGTMDHQHIATSIPLLEAGYDMLLEKPFATNVDEMWQLVALAERLGRKVAICHVLRYSPFYAAIRQKVIDGAIGDIINIQATEHVSYHHHGTGYVRGKWSRKDYSQSTMLMAKSCHDLDLIAWMKSGVDPMLVSSFGSNYQFRRDRAPRGAGTRCLVDCPIEADCLYSAKKHYIDHPRRWRAYVWNDLEHIPKPTIEDKIESLKHSSYGRCVWKSDNDVVDHQSVVVEFEDGATATLNMIGGTCKPERSIHLIGTTGEIQGNFGDNRFVVRHIDPRAGHEYSEETVDLAVTGDMTGAYGGHGGGDLRLVEDFVKVLEGVVPSISYTGIADSVSGHLIGFSADQAREQGITVPLKHQSIGNAPTSP